MGKTPIDKLKGLGLDTIRAEGGSVIYNRLDLSDRTLSVLALAIACIAFGFAFHSTQMSRISERESRLAQAELLLLRGSLIAHGIPTDIHDQLRKEPKK